MSFIFSDSVDFSEKLCCHLWSCWTSLLQLLPLNTYHRALLFIIFNIFLKKSWDLLWITNSGDHRRVWSANLLHPVQCRYLTTRPYCRMVESTTLHLRDAQFNPSCVHWNMWPITTTSKFETWSEVEVSQEQIF